MTNTLKPLTVYSASAGAGKTFKLATQYISLLILNPLSYRSILAVTFTNKATEEMKMRILSQLYGISKGLNDSKAYLNEIISTTGLQKPMIKQRASWILKLLLHHYDDFKVETIDAFFQTVLRNLAYELNLTANLKISLNDQEVLDQCIDNLIEQLDENSPVLRWIMDYIHEKMDDDKGWNIIRQIKDFGKNIFGDAYKKNFKELEPLMAPGNEFFTKFSEHLHCIKTNAEQTIKQYADRFFQTMEESGYSASDLSRGEKGIWNYFSRLQSGEFTDDAKLHNNTVKKCLEDPKNWVTKQNAVPGKGVYALVEAKLWPLLKEAESKLLDLVNDYKSADLTLRHLNTLRLLGKIGEEVRTSNQEASRFLLSDTQNLLSSLIDDSDSPFIFEKIGARLEHIMIDEFQDTSRIQWDNFKVLLKETMSHGLPPSKNIAQNLIVGDIKQSIYRWRGGDWKLLQGIKDEFSGQVDKKNLDTNFRSDRNIINFNNTFFEKATQSSIWSADGKAQEQLTKAYNIKDLRQEIPASKGDNGSVHIELLPNNEDYHDLMLQKTVEMVRQLLQAGCKERDIAILVRKNPTIQEIGSYFMDQLPEVTLVSDLAFRLDASQAVNILIDALRLMIHRDDALSLSNLTKAYQTEIKHPGKSDNELFLCPGKTVKERLESQLPEAYINHLDELMRLPLVDLIEQLYAIFELSQLNEQSAYICAFYDQVNAYLQENSPDIEDFLNVWDENLHTQSIQSEEANGIRLLTIHKSKGLEFDHVIIPFCDWIFEKPGYTLWCSPEKNPYNELPVIPVDLYKKQMCGSVFEHFYKEEHSQNVVDNMNLLYVAFTRAKRGLYIFGKNKDKDKASHKTKSTSSPAGPVDESDVIGRVLPDIADELQVSVSKVSENEGQPSDQDDKSTKGKDSAQETLVFDYGTPDIKTAGPQEKVSDNIFLQPVLSKKITVNNYRNRVDFRESNKSKDFIEGDDEEIQEQNEYIRTGNVMHAIFSSIRTLDDVDQALDQLEQDGVLDTGNLSKEKLKDIMRQRLESDKVRDWFSSRWELFNECTILYRDPDTNETIEKRPDRVMADEKEMIVVDFKFGKPHKEYEDQVRTYMSLLSQMQQLPVSGYLWYVYPNRIQQVLPTKS
ncbi:UvrD-helicase domain-containing protein [Prevotella cerevisiae]|uniref:DNA 3'-5' helicase n=1 Tax=Segatella cerevisiae TaxID=2053716 RepID=A0ABT1BXW2_9BACT|nr:UvrD-helicase domain-containing protein [Segatella cerevisiae]MCO6025098.1 UvrD-helicase domain-containing protein [Segatella cerevisiae]